MRIALFSQAYSALVDCICDIVSPKNLVVVDFSNKDVLIHVCQENRIKYIRFDSWEQIISEMSDYDLIISYKLNKIIPMVLLNRIKYGGLNIHPSLLPKYPGSNPWFHMYYSMETEGGVTIHRVAEEPDSGNIIIQRPFRIELGQPLPSAIKIADNIACELIREVFEKKLYLIIGIKQTPCDNYNIALESLKFMPVERLWHILRGFPSLIHTIYTSLPHRYFEVGEFFREKVDGSLVGSIRNNDKGCWIVCNDGLISLFDFMQIPMTSDYLTALKTSDLADFERNQDGSLKYIQGREAIVFPAQINGSKVAVRFIRNITSQQITVYLERLESLKYLFRKYSLKHFPDFVVVTNAVKLSKGNFPALIMNWVQGQTLIPFLKHNIRHTRQLHVLLGKFVEGCRQNHVAGIVHSDLHSGNILVDNDGRLSIIDIDNTWHPTFGYVNDSAGNCNYQHPMRRLNKCITKYIDYFSEIIISATIYVAIYAPDLFKKYSDDECLLVEQDYLTPDESPLISELSKNPLTASLASLIIRLCHEYNLENIPPVETINLFCQ